MSSFPVPMDMSGTPGGTILALRQQLADMALALEDTRGKLETSETRINELEDENNELKDSCREIAADDPDATITQYIDDQQGEYHENYEIEDDDDYDAMIREKAEVLEVKKEAAEAKHRAFIAEMQVNQLARVNDSLVEENTRHRTNLIEAGKIIEALKEERNSHKPSLLRERTAHVKDKGGVAKGRMVKDKAARSRHLASVVDSICSLPVRQKQNKSGVGEGAMQ